MILAYDQDGKIDYDLTEKQILLSEDGDKDGFTLDLYEKGKFVLINMMHEDGKKLLNGMLLPKNAYNKITKNKIKKRLSKDDWKYVTMYMGAPVYSSLKYKIKQWLKEQWFMIYYVSILGKYWTEDREALELKKQTIKDYKEYLKVLNEIKKRPDYDRKELFNYIEVS